MVRFGENNEVLEDNDYRAILAGVQREEDISYYMEELCGLAEAAGIEVAGQLIQNLDRPNSATYLGKGKVEELAELCRNMEVDTVIFNDELSGVQLRNLEAQMEVRVIDRTILILDIFASRATSKEGKLQVELAQLKYRIPRLIGFGKSLSRLGGGIGTRGPGEKKLETDRRHIDKRMEEIKREIMEVRANRSTQRSRREKSEIPVVALVGYTNSGKSAIMNYLLTLTDQEEKTVFEKNMLFATLDTFQRKIRLDSNHEFVLIDTVGFVSKLPHTLVQAFKATLEEVLYADLLLHVVDSAYSGNEFHVEVTETVLNEIGADGKEKLLVYNKVDLLEEGQELPLTGKDAVYVSAKQGTNMDQLLEKVKSSIFSDRMTVNLLIPFERGDVTSYLCERSKPIKTEYRENGTYLEIELSQADCSRVKEFLAVREEEDVSI